MADGNDSRVTFGGVLKAFIKLAFWLVVITALAIGGYYVYQELTRQFSRVWDEIDANEEALEALQDEADALRAGAPTLEAGLAAAVAGREDAERELSAMEEALLADLAAQEELLAGLQTELEGLAAQSEAMTGTVALLGEGIRLLQDDLNENRMATDALGGSIDALEGDVDFLEAEASRLEEAIVDPAAELARMQRVLLLFQVWELTSRARLHLLNDNAGLAEEDITRAVRLLDAVARSGDSLLNREDVGALRQRLELALDGLPDDPETAIGDLEMAWDRLDELLAALLIGQPDATQTTPGAEELTATAASTPDQESETPVDETGTPTPATEPPVPSETPGPAVTPEGTATPTATAAPEESETPEATATP